MHRPDTACTASIRVVVTLVPLSLGVALAEGRHAAKSGPEDEDDDEGDDDEGEQERHGCGGRMTVFTCAGVRL